MWYAHPSKVVEASRNSRDDRLTGYLYLSFSLLVESSGPVVSCNRILFVHVKDVDPSLAVKCVNPIWISLFYTVDSNFQAQAVSGHWFDFGNVVVVLFSCLWEIGRKRRRIKARRSETKTTAESECSEPKSRCIYISSCEERRVLSVWSHLLRKTVKRVRVEQEQIEARICYSTTRSDIWVQQQEEEEEGEEEKEEKEEEELAPSGSACWHAPSLLLSVDDTETMPSSCRLYVTRGFYFNDRIFSFLYLKILTLFLFVSIDLVIVVDIYSPPTLLVSTEKTTKWKENETSRKRRRRRWRRSES